jgi:hypothetical protein
MPLLRRQRVVTGDQALTEHERAAGIAQEQEVAGRANRLAVYEVLRQQNRAPSIGSAYLRGARRAAHRSRTSALATHKPQAETGLKARSARRGDLSRTGWLPVAWADGEPLATRKATAPAGRLQKSRLPSRPKRKKREAA